MKALSGLSSAEPPLFLSPSPELSRHARATSSHLFSSLLAFCPNKSRPSKDALIVDDALEETVYGRVGVKTDIAQLGVNGNKSSTKECNGVQKTDISAPVGNNGHKFLKNVKGSKSLTNELERNKKPDLLRVERVINDEDINGRSEFVGTEGEKGGEEVGGGGTCMARELRRWGEKERQLDRAQPR